MEEQVNWVPAIAVLVSGLIIGLIVVLMSRSKRESLPPEPEEETLDDLQERSDLLIRQLQEMDVTSDPDERRKVELEAAALLRRIEELRAESSVEPGPAVEQDDEEKIVAPAGGIPRFLWGVGTAVLVGAIVWFVVSYMSVRDESGMLTGGLPGMTSAPAPAASSPQALRLEEWVAANPGDLDARLDLARVYLMDQELLKVWDQTQYVLERSPNHPRALSYAAVVRLAMGQTAVALEMLESALVSDPTLLDARIHLALAYLQLDRRTEAIRILNEAREIDPDQSPMIDQILDEISQQWPEG
jgi:tetratricopeptide (TPR) repeat protein